MYQNLSEGKQKEKKHHYHCECNKNLSEEENEKKVEYTERYCLTHKYCLS